jgi:polyisoprenoid-binding protein YceI
MNTDTQVKTMWGIDVAHSEVHFKVKHMMVSTVTGSFKEFEGNMETNEGKLEGADIWFNAVIDSIDTNNEQRDAHLKSDDFFNAEKFPQMKFKSANMVKKAEGKYELTGDLTIRDITKSVVLSVDYFGTAVDPYGQTKSGFEINGAISRKEFDLKWNAITEAGGVVVSDEVKLSLNIQMVQQ